MKKINLTAFYVGIWGRLFLQLKEKGYLKKDNSPQTKFRFHKDGSRAKLSLVEKDILDVYATMRDKLKNVPQWKIDDYAELNNEYIRNLVNDKQQVVNVILACAMYRSYLDDYGTVYERNLMIRRLDNIINSYDDRETVKYSARCGDNLYRQFVGKPQLSDEVRDARAKRFLR
jgi:hypothetical protein